MRKLYEIVLVIAAAGLAATMALIEIPTHSPDLGTVVGGGSLSAGPPPVVDSSFPPLPPLLFPPGFPAPGPIEPPATSAPSLPLGAQPPQDVAEASLPAMGVFGTSLAQHAPTPTTEPPPATKKPKPPPTSDKPKPPPATKPKSEIKPEDRRKGTLAESSPRSIGSAADQAMAA